MKNYIICFLRISLFFFFLVLNITFVSAKKKIPFPKVSKYSDEVSVDSSKLLIKDSIIYQSDSLLKKRIVPKEYILPLADLTYTDTKELKKIIIKHANLTWYNRIILYIKMGFQNQNKFIRNSYVLIVIFLSLFILINLFIYINRVRLGYWSKRQVEMENRFELLLTGIIFNEANEVGIEKWESEKQALIAHYNKYYLKNKFNRQLLVSMLMSLHRNFLGTPADILKKLYLDFEFDKSGMKILKKANNWSLNVKVIRDLTQMEITESVPLIKPFLSHLNPILRTEAGIALLKLDLENPFSLLDQNVELTDWQQLNLFEAIKSSTKLDIPLFSKWFNVNQVSIIVFSLLLVEHFDQKEAISEIKTLLNHPSSLVKQRAIALLRKFDVKEMEELLLGMYRNGDMQIKLEILETLGSFASIKSIEFLKDRLLNDEFTFAIESATSLRKIGEIGENELQILKLAYDGKEGDTFKIICHALDNRLSIN